MTIKTFRLAAILSMSSFVIRAVSASIVDVIYSLATFVLTAFGPRPQPINLVGATETIRTIGLSESRAFARRRIDRPDSRSRAPASMAFVTA